MDKKFPTLKELQEQAPDLTPRIEELEKMSKKRGRGFSVWNAYFALLQVQARWPDKVQEAVPYVNMLTFRDWKKIGRVVKKGEKALKIVVFVTCKAKDEKGKEIEDEDYSFPKSCNIFCIWQTEPLEKE